MTPAPQDATLLLPVRHGETPTTGQVLPGPAPGLHLSENGRAQAERFARRLAGLAVDAINSSPLERTLETARPAGLATGLEAGIEAELLECDFGEWTGASLADLAKLPQWRRIRESPSGFRFPGGEAFTHLQERIASTLARRGAEHPGGVGACFSHAGPIKVAVAHALGVAPDNFQRIAISPRFGPCRVAFPGTGTRGAHGELDPGSPERAEETMKRKQRCSRAS